MPAPVNQPRGLGVDGLGRWLHRLWPAYCLVCREAALPDRDLCAACFGALPWNDRACRRCAIPLAAADGVAGGSSGWGGSNATHGGGVSATGAIAVMRPAVGAALETAVGSAIGPAIGVPDAIAAPDVRDACSACGVQGAQAARVAPKPPGVCDDDMPTCGACLRRAPPLQRVHAACRYAAPLDRLLPRFKFHGDLAAGRLLAQLMADALHAADRPDAVIAVPLHRARLRARGYDQALELARPLARTLRLPLLADALLRERATAPQSRLDAAQRRRNLRRAFRLAADARLPAHVVLVDDVMTTGATLHAAARALHRAGVARVDAWVCARVPAPG